MTCGCGCVFLSLCVCMSVRRGVHPAYEGLDRVYPLTSTRIADRLQHTCSCLAHWAPIFGEVRVRVVGCVGDRNVQTNIFLHCHLNVYFEVYFSTLLLFYCVCFVCGCGCVSCPMCRNWCFLSCCYSETINWPRWRAASVFSCGGATAGTLPSPTLLCTLSPQ